MVNQRNNKRNQRTIKGICLAGIAFDIDDRLKNIDAGILKQGVKALQICVLEIAVDCLTMTLSHYTIFLINLFLKARFTDDFKRSSQAISQFSIRFGDWNWKN